MNVSSNCLFTAYTKVRVCISTLDTRTGSEYQCFGAYVSEERSSFGSASAYPSLMNANIALSTVAL